MENLPDIRVSAPWITTVLLALFQGALLYEAGLAPQYGEGAIGGGLKLVAAFILYAVQIFGVTPWIFVRALKAGYETESVMRFAVLWPLTIGPLGLLIVFVFDRMHT